MWKIDSEGNTHFTVTSNGMTHEEWEQNFARRSRPVSQFGRQVLHRVSAPTRAGTAHKVVVRPAWLFREDERYMENVYRWANERSWASSHWEVACLILNGFTDEQLRQMGLGAICTVHSPINDDCGEQRILSTRHNDSGKYELGAYTVYDLSPLDTRFGFAFEAP